MARFGQLYLDGGLRGTTRVLPASWVELTKTPAPPVATPTLHVSDNLGERGGSYGASFWLNSATPTAAPETLFYAEAPHARRHARRWGERYSSTPRAAPRLALPRGFRPLLAPMPVLS